MSEPKLGPTEFQAEIERLKAAGQLPELHELLAAVADSRSKFADKIIAARKTGEDNELG
jgi:hypothetical protein